MAVLAIGFVSCEGYRGPAWSHLLGSTVKSSGMKMPDLQCPQGLLLSSEVKASGIFCRSGHWELCYSCCMAEALALPPFLSPLYTGQLC